MDTRALTQAMHEATEGIKPRTGFADEVVTGSRRRRARNRIAVASTVVGTAVVAVMAVTAPQPLSAPPPGYATIVAPEPKDDWRMAHQGGEHIDDATRVTDVVETWTAGLGPMQLVNLDGRYDDRPGDPHVYWAGETSYGEAAIVMEAVRLGPGGDQRILTGVVAATPSSPEPRLLGVQVDGPGERGHFVLPDNQTVLAVAHPEMGLWVSPEIVYTDDGSRREWTALEVDGGVGIHRLPEGTNPINARLVAGDPTEPPARDNLKLGGHLPLVVTGGYPNPDPPRPLRRGLRWTSYVELSNDLSDQFDPGAEFAKALRESGLLDPSSYEDQRSPWLISTRVFGGVLLIGEVQELDHRAYVYVATPGEDGRYVVERTHAVDPYAVLPVAHRLSDDSGVVVAAPGKTLSYRTSPAGAWVPAGRDAARLPAEAVQVRVDDEVVDPP